MTDPTLATHTVSDEGTVSSQVRGLSSLIFDAGGFPALDFGLDLVSDAVLAPLTEAIRDSMPRFDLSSVLLASPVVTLSAWPAICLGSSLETILSAFRELFGKSGNLWRGVMPQNISAADVVLDVEVLERLMFDEGLPLAWVPRAATLEAVFRAVTPAQRRAVIGRRWKSVVDDCEALLLAITSDTVTQWAAYGLKAVAGMRDGHYELAQAMSMTTLDSVLHRAVSPANRQLFSARSRPQTEEMSIRNFFMFGQLWGIHRHYYPGKGDPIPRGINRHGSVHGVSRIQYSRINSVLALAHLASLLWNLDIAVSRSGPSLSH